VAGKTGEKQGVSAIRPIGSAWTHPRTGGWQILDWKFGLKASGTDSVMMKFKNALRGEI
jgi:hypothetical protein